MKIRIAKNSDVNEFIRIKSQLSFKRVDGKSTKSGFLLGTEAETYLEYIENDYCLVLENGTSLIGFGIILKDESVRQSEIWIKRDSADWSIDINEFVSKKICYFEQLAFLKGHSRQVLKIAYNALNWAFEDGHEHMFASTVNFPISNLAAVPYILKASGKKVGNIDEVYPKIGQINSDIYHIEAKKFYPCVKSHPLFPFLAKNTIQFR